MPLTNAEPTDITKNTGYMKSASEYGPSMRLAMDYANAKPFAEIMSRRAKDTGNHQLMHLAKMFELRAIRTADRYKDEPTESKRAEISEAIGHMQEAIQEPSLCRAIAEAACNVNDRDLEIFFATLVYKDYIRGPITSGNFKDALRNENANNIAVKHELSLFTRAVALAQTLAQTMRG